MSEMQLTKGWCMSVCRNTLGIKVPYSYQVTHSVLIGKEPIAKLIFYSYEERKTYRIVMHQLKRGLHVSVSTYDTHDRFMQNYSSAYYVDWNTGKIKSKIECCRMEPINAEKKATRL